MACVPVVGPAIAPLLAPIVTAGFVATLFTKSIFYPLAWYLVFWHVVTFAAFYIDAPLGTVVDFISWPLGVFIIAQLVAAFVTQMGNFPRLFNFVHVLRTYTDASSGIYDRRRTVWEGVAFALSVLAIYFGILFVVGAFSDGCSLIGVGLAETIGWILIVVGIVGIIVLAIVTWFSVHAHNLERLRMWKYVIAGVFIIVLSALAHDLLYALAPGIGIWYGAIGLIFVVVGWVALYWYINGVHFYSDIQASDAYKALRYDETAAKTYALLDAIDGFENTDRLLAFVVTGAIYNILGVLLVWLVAALVTTAPLFWSFIAFLIFSAVAVIIVIIVAYMTTFYGAHPSGNNGGANYKRV